MLTEKQNQGQTHENLSIEEWEEERPNKGQR